MINLIHFIVINIAAIFISALPMVGGFGTAYNIKFIKENGFKLFFPISFVTALILYFFAGINFSLIYTILFILLSFIYLIFEKIKTDEFNKIAIITFLLTSFIYVIYTIFWNNLIRIPNILKTFYISDVKSIFQLGNVIATLPKDINIFDINISFYIYSIALKKESYYIIFSLLFIFTLLIYCVLKYKEIDNWEVSYLFTIPFIVALLIIINISKFSYFNKIISEIAINTQNCIFLIYLSYGVKEINRNLRGLIKNSVFRAILIFFLLIKFNMFYFIFGALQSFRSKKSKYLPSLKQ